MPLVGAFTTMGLSMSLLKKVIDATVLMLRSTGKLGLDLRR
jgi:hypothetical protein